MGTKEKLLTLLEECRGQYLSGEEIAEKLSVSRTAVWKAAKQLRESGFSIHAVTNRGYTLESHTDLLTENSVRRYLLPQYQCLSLEVLAAVSSTNSLLRERASAGAGDGYVLIANEQNKGRGRLGRTFYSPPGSGLYMSLLLRPIGLNPQEAIRITTMAAVAACEAAEEISGKEAGIKWVNDIYMDGKKVSGILTEATFDLESGNIDYIVLGIGMNVYMPEAGFPEDISHIAGSILEQPTDDGKSRLAALFLNHFLEYYHAEDPAYYSDIYRRKSIVIGKDITIITPTAQRNAFALDIDRECRLVVRYDDGTIGQLSSSEISIRPQPDINNTFR